MSDADSSRARSTLDRAADYMLNASVLQRIGIAIASTVLALLIGTIIVWRAGYDPVNFLRVLYDGSIGDIRVLWSDGSLEDANALARTLRYTTLFVLAGVAVAIAFRAGVFNIGVQGQIIFGAIACALSIVWLAPFLPEGAIGGVLLIVVGILAAMVAGGLYGMFPGVLKAYAGANEIITTIMLNFIAIGIVGWAVNGPVKDPESATARTRLLPEYVSFPRVLFDNPDFSIVGLLITIALVAVVAIIMARTNFGYDMVTSGYQTSAATYSGVDARRTIVATMTFSGMVAGLTGAIFVIMIRGAFGDPASFSTYGFDAIAVSLLAANNPVGVIPAGLLFGALNASTTSIQIDSGVPVQLIDGIIGLVVLFVAAPEMFRMAAARTGLGGEDR